MKIGSYGQLVFEASSGRILSFPELSRTVSANLETHAIAGSQPIVEFVGPGDDKITLDMTFNRQWGVDPKTETDRLISMCKTGARYPLIIGGEPVGGAGALWILTDVGEARPIIDNRGVTIMSKVSVGLQLAPDPPQIVASTGNVQKSSSVVVRRRVSS